MAQRLRNTKERNGKRDFAIQKRQGFPQEKATATAWRISEDFAKRVSAKSRSAPCRLLRNWVCFYAKTCRSLARVRVRTCIKDYGTSNRQFSDRIRVFLIMNGIFSPLKRLLMIWQIVLDCISANIVYKFIIAVKKETYILNTH